MKAFLKLLPILLFFEPTVHAATYWLDQSCTTGRNAQNVRAAVQDAINMAKRGRQRLDSSTDTYQSSVYKTIFKGDRNNQADRDLVTDVLGQPQQDGIAGFTSTNNRLTSNIRIYCDNDSRDRNPQSNARWKLVPDVPDAEIPNSRKPDPQVEWQDAANGIRTRGIAGCARAGIQAATYTATIPAHLNGQPDERATITICDYQLRRNLHTLDGLPRKRDIGRLVRDRVSADKKPVDFFQVVTSLVLVHEFCHLPPWIFPDHEYRWSGMMSLPAPQTYQNPDCYAYFCLLAVLADRKWILTDNQVEGNMKYSLSRVSTKRAVLRWERRSAKFVM